MLRSSTGRTGVMREYMQGMQGKWCERHGLNVKDIHRYRGKISDC